MKKLHDKKHQKRIHLILAAIIVPSFVLSGSLVLLSREKSKGAYTGKIFGKKISAEEVRSAALAVKNLGIIQYGDQFEEVRKHMNIESQAWERLLLLSEARNRHIQASDKEVLALLEEYPFFQKDGQFNELLYNETLQYAFMTPARTFEEEIRQNIMISKLFNQVTDFISDLNDREIRDEYRKLNEAVNLFYIAGLSADFSKDVPTEEKELTDYFSKNSIEFKQPLSFNIEYGIIESPQPDDPLTKDTIKKIFNRLHKNEDFAAVAKEFGFTIKETGLFSESDPIPAIGWSPQVTAMIAKTAIGKYLIPLQMDKNFYIIKVKGKKDPFIPEFEAIKDKIKERFVKNKAKELAMKKTVSCAEKLQELYKTNLKTVNLEQIAKEFGLKYGVADSVKFNSYIEGVGSSDIFWITAQKLQDEGISDVIETPSGFYVLKLKNRTPFDEKKFTEEKKTFSQTLLEQKKSDFFTRFTQELKTKAFRF